MAQNGLFPVTRARHGQRYWKRFNSYEFALWHSECEIVSDEIVQAAAAFPIVFRKTTKGMAPRAILSLSANLTTPFVSQDGQWRAAYVPSSLRSHPFHAGRIKEGDEDPDLLFQLFVDEASDLVTDDAKDEAFFDASGEVSNALHEVRVFLRARAAAASATQDICNELSALGLFERLSKHAGVDLSPDVFGISASRLRRLTQTQKATLLDTGAMQLIHAHQVSLSHLEWLTRAQHQRAQRRAPEKYTENSDIFGFLCAMANAQNDDLFMTYGV